MAQTRSQIRIFSKKTPVSTTRPPARAPKIEPPPALTKAHGQVIATKPANMPLHIMDGSGFLVLTHHIQSVDASAPVAEASMGLTATTLMRKSGPARVDPGLNPNQPKARMNEASIAI